MNEIDRLLTIMERLRDPDSGCPWDLEQDFATIAPYTIEEAYEVADAIERGEHEDLKDELGDLLFQVVFHAQMASEKDLFDFEDVARAISAKMVRRHPHVFADGAVENAEAQTSAWEAHKAQERAEKDRRGNHGLLDDIPVALPALVRARKLGKRAALVGFDWADAEGVRAKVEEELGELDEALSGAREPQALEEELGDLLFALANLGRHLGLHAEEALQRANRKFLRRFGFIEKTLGNQRRSLEEASLEEMEALWNQSKKTLQE